MVILADQALEGDGKVVAGRRGRWSIWTTIHSDLPTRDMARSMK